MIKLKPQKDLIDLLKHKKPLSTVAILSISGLMMLFFTISETDDKQNFFESSQMGIPQNMDRLLFGTDMLDQGKTSPNDAKILDSCSTANLLIGKNGIAKCNT